ncbi:MAG: MoaD/ThiS family protein [Planctomycetaceae bacterium]
MSVRIEFYGVPRQIAGRACLDVQGETIAAAVLAALEEIPALCACCDPDGHVRPGYILNLNGRQFVSDPAQRLQAGDQLLLLSADAGG